MKQMINIKYIINSRVNKKAFNQLKLMIKIKKINNKNKIKNQKAGQ